MSKPNDNTPKPNHIEVATVTTAGICPAAGFDEVPSHQPLKVELHRISKKLGLTDTSGWIATLAGRELDIALSYEALQLEGPVELHWGPREGGGGSQ